MDLKAACCVAFCSWSLLHQSPWAVAQGLDPAEVSFTELDQQVLTARQAIVEGRYDVAIKTCEGILQKDARNLDALKMLGSAYYLLDDRSRAGYAWERALAINPKDQGVQTFLASLSKSD